MADVKISEYLNSLAQILAEQTTFAHITYACRRQISILIQNQFSFALPKTLHAGFQPKLH